MRKIGIIGGGFTGTMTTVQLIEKATIPIEIFLINEKETLVKGIAFNPYSEKHLLNVISGKMSAFSDSPDHFLDWVMSQEKFVKKDRTLIANSFMPRKLYGEYLESIWEATKTKASQKGIKLIVIDNFVEDLEVSGDFVSLWLGLDGNIIVDYCVIASGNQLPRNPRINNMDFYKCPNYFQNPWKLESIINLNDNLPVLIIGNGLTMVDTVLGLLENGFKGEIYSISPNGFNILPHRHNGLKYTKLAEEMREGMSLLDLVRIVNKHIKTVREYGVSAEPVIDSLRPYTQKLWKSFSEHEKVLFMRRLRHLWGVARHRIPLHTHDKIQQMRIEGKIHICSGKILNFIESKEGIQVEYLDKKTNSVKELRVSRIINCTGPETDMMKLGKGFLKSCLMKGTITQDVLKLGIKTNPENLHVLDNKGIQQENLFTLGSNLKGELWESTAVNELRDQAERLAKILIQKCEASVKV